MQILEKRRVLWSSKALTEAWRVLESVVFGHCGKICKWGYIEETNFEETNSSIQNADLDVEN